MNKQEKMATTNLQCHSADKKVRVNFDWTIHNIQLKQHCFTARDKLSSAIFSAEGDSGIQWRLNLYLKGDSEKNKGYLSLYLELMKSSTPEIFTNFQLSVRNTEDKSLTLISHHATSKFSSNTKELGWPRIMKEEELYLKLCNNTLVDDRLVINCQLTYLLSSSPTIGIRPALAVASRLKSGLKKDLTTLFNDMTYSDVTINVMGQTFQAHKLILATRSPVFAAMFQHDMQEQRSNEIHIIDTDPKVFQELLRFIYTGEVERIEELASDLLQAANKYMCSQLKFKCEDFLAHSLAVENCCGMFLEADLSSAEHLKKAVFKFFCKFATGAMATNGWNELKRGRADLACELLECFVVYSTAQDYLLSFY